MAYQNSRIAIERGRGSASLWRPNPRRDTPEAVARRLLDEGMAPMAVFMHVSENYAFALPTQPVLEEILKHGPIIEIGAGLGYWARRLRALGADIIAYDPQMPGKQRGGRREVVRSAKLFPVKRGSHRVAGSHPDRALLMIWPSKGENWAAEAVRMYEGQTILYVGDRGFRQTANGTLPDALRAGGFRRVRQMPVGSWPFNFMDWLCVYERKATGRGWWPFRR